MEWQVTPSVHLPLFSLQPAPHGARSDGEANPYRSFKVSPTEGI